MAPIPTMFISNQEKGKEVRCKIQTPALFLTEVLENPGEVCGQRGTF